MSLSQPQTVLLPCSSPLKGIWFSYSFSVPGFYPGYHTALTSPCLSCHCPDSFSVLTCLPWSWQSFPIFKLRFFSSVWNPPWGLASKTLPSRHLLTSLASFLSLSSTVQQPHWRPYHCHEWKCFRNSSLITWGPVIGRRPPRWTRWDSVSEISQPSTAVWHNEGWVGDCGSRVEGGIP